MRNAVLFMVTLPFLVLLLAWDLVKLPIVLVIFLPMSLFMWLVEFIQGDSNFKDYTIGFLVEVSIIGVLVYLDFVWKKDIRI